MQYIKNKNLHSVAVLGYRQFFSPFLVVALAFLCLMLLMLAGCGGGGSNGGAPSTGGTPVVKHLAAGFYHSCARLDNGAVKCWGYNGFGQLGLGDVDSRGDQAGEMGSLLPTVSLGSGRTAMEIAAGEEHTCARLDNGSVKCWGWNIYGQLGLGDTTTRGHLPNQMGDQLPVVNLGTGRTAAEIAAGDNHTCARLDNGSVKCWGYNAYGQLGLGDIANRGDQGNAPAPVPPATVTYDSNGFFHLNSGQSTYVGYKPDSYNASTPISLFVWMHGCGGNAEGDLWMIAPPATRAHQSYIAISIGGRDGGCWNMTADRVKVLAAVTDVSKYFNISPKKIYLGGYSSGGNLSYRIAYENASLFAGVLVENSAPFRGTGLTQSAALAAASWKFNVAHLAHLSDTTYVIGDVRAETDALQNAGYPITRIEKEGSHYDNAGAVVNGVVVPGTSADFQQFLLPYLDAGWVAPTITPGDEMGDQLPAVNLGAGRTAVEIVAGGNHTCARLDNGSVKCWGWNDRGQLGLGDVAHRGDQVNQMGDSLLAVNLGTGRTAVELIAGQRHTCARLDNGSVKCWGDNGSGQLGLGDAAKRGDQINEMGDQLPIVSLGTGRTAVEILAGAGHTCARLDNGSIKCWGWNLNGQLGLGDVADRGDQANEMGSQLPMVSLGTGRTAVEMVGGGLHTCVRLDNASVKCWGYNGFGQLGLGDAAQRGDQANEMGDQLPSISY